ncbi:MAG: recombination mediator RecR [Treponema sp.]|nr:recombination mediator RecR [Treponema sp.]
MSSKRSPNSFSTLDKLVVLLSRLPGVGKKSASRLVYHILEGDPSYAQSLALELSGLHERIIRCSTCGSFTEHDPCPICTDPSRDRSLLCVVERAQDVRVIDESQEFGGVFHVLGGLIAPLEGINPGDLAIPALMDRIRQGEVKEVILALNPTIEGDTTSLFIQKYLNEKLPALELSISRLASGLPVGGDLEYADRLTLSRSFRGRVKM